MKITDFEMYRYTLPLALPLVLEGKEQRSREGIILFIRGDNHKTGLGEIAPLPGFSAEHLQDAEKQLFMLRDKVLNTTIPDDLESLTFRFETWVRTWKLYPSVRCGFEVAVLDLLARSQARPLRCFIHEDAADRVPGTILLSHNTRKVMQREVSDALHLGACVFKLKVGDPDIKTDLDRVMWVKEVTEDKALLRLDANRQWEYAQAASFVKAVDLQGIEYLEEPLKDIEQLEEFSAVTQVPLALDETTREWQPKRIAGLSTLKALVLKPMFLGGWEKTMGWVRAAQDAGLQAVISSSFESAVGIRALAHLACAAGGAAAGLDTSKWYSDNLLDEPFECTSGMIIPGPFDLEKSDLDFQLIRAVHND
ncbi:MAG: o-succinylbenzoate synthase [Candidatus Omnitrophica bacterium]|nr:o-succinylbenzoate synthase [Candidatus Omnitrophota bacterium]